MPTFNTVADPLVESFAEGVNDYQSGEVPEGWDDREKREHSPYLSGWYMASMWEVSTGWLDIQDDEGNLIDREDKDNDVPDDAETGVCKHCTADIAFVNGGWIDPEATGDDRIWRETCPDNHEDRIAAHEPEEEN